MSARTQLEEKIYQAQCYGSVEPIEYMVPYPNLGTLVSGQNIKKADKTWYSPANLSYGDLNRKINQTANWLSKNDVSRYDRVILCEVPCPAAEILAFALWSIGASVVLARDMELSYAVTSTGSKLIFNGQESPAVTGKMTVSIPGYQELEIIVGDEPVSFTPSQKSLLGDEAMVYWSEGRGVCLSHYNLMVNASAAGSALGLDQIEKVCIDIPQESTAWAVLQLIAPVYEGIAIDHREGEVVIGLPGQFAKPDYLINFNWLEPAAGDPPNIFICPEVTAVAKIGDNPVRLLKIINKGPRQIVVNGHHVMIGYLDDNANKSAFTENGLLINL